MDELPGNKHGWRNHNLKDVCPPVIISPTGVGAYQ